VLPALGTTDLGLRLRRVGIGIGVRVGIGMLSRARRVVEWHRVAAREQYQCSKKNESPARIHINPAGFYFVSLIDSIPALAVTALGSTGLENS
jgi:hypothetical protein